MKHRISYSRMPHCPRLYQFENLQGHRDDNAGDMAAMGEIGHKLLSEHVDFCSRKNILRSEGHFNYLVAKYRKQVPMYLEDQFLEVCERFQWTFNLDLRAETHITEIELGVNEKLEPCDVEADCDRLTGRPDYIAIYPDKSASIHDWKLGWAMYDLDDAQYNFQLALYAFLWFCHHPECEKVRVTIWGPRWGFKNRSSHDWTRESLAASDINPAEQFKSALVVAKYYERESGDEDWPHASNWNWCKWCHPELQCPELVNADGYLKQVLYG